MTLFSSALLEHGSPALRWGCVLAATLAAALIDARTRRIPNALTGGLLAAGLLHAGLVAGAAGLVDAGLACVLLALPYVLLFVVAGGGAGDAKLMGAAGAWLGLADGLVALLATCLCGVILGLAWARARGRLAQVLQGLAPAAGLLLHLPFRRMAPAAAASALPAPGQGLTMPYGPAIFAGCLLACGARLAC